MTILWCGGEDVDFQAQGTGVTVDTTSGHFRSGYARCAISCATSTGEATSRAAPLSAGAVTSAWVHFQCYSGVFFGNHLIAGLANSASGNGSGIYVGTTGTKAILYKWDGTTATQLGSTGVNTLPTNLPFPVDLQISSYGASSTITLYLNGSSTADIAFSGSSAITGVSNLDCASVAARQANGVVSEVIIADSDTRTLALVTNAPNAAGDANNWTTGTYASINPTTINDANVIAVNTTTQDFQANLIDLPSGSFSVAAVKIAARAELTAGAVPTGLKLGVKSSGTVNVGSANTLTTAWVTYERLMLTNPVTAAAWTVSDINALQLDLQSA